MKEPLPFTDFIKKFIFIIASLLVMLLFWYLRNTWLLTFLAIIIAIGMSIPARWIQRRFKWKRGPATITAVLLVGLFIYLLILIIFPPIVSEIGSLLKELPRLLQSAVEGYDQLRAGNEIIGRLLPALTDETLVNLSYDQALIDQLINTARSILGTGLPLVAGGLNAAASLVGNILLVLILAILFLLNPLSYIQGTLFLLPQRYHPRLLAIWNELYLTITTWLKAQFTSITVTAFLVYVILGVILGMPNAITVAVIAGFSSFIPNIGALIPLIPITLFQLAADPSRLLIVLPVYLAIQLTESNIITPSIVKAELNIPAGAVLLVQVVTAVLFGAIGVLLAVPLLAVTITLVSEVYSQQILGLDVSQLRLIRDLDGRLALAPPPPLPEDAPDES